ncbi:AsmA family protein [Roseospira goensis]|uniref:Uncharacterized protein involved in outer membrane biogenesis n=1 Tax=Roseospira goensis TaxID=391922 RepID=A0A7W6WKK9_9PROT|nr:AsmA family protein [Roseospira goensis]MBB4286426.1 uncharacterized protein involved in outer membrane biogenesis [Roseospira goensis]
MKKLLLVLASVLVVAVVVALVAPSFIDWNRYRSEIAARIEAATGRPAAIDGALSFRILPTPVLSVAGLRLANIAGGSTADMVRIDALRVAVDLAPLLRGEVRVRSVRMIDPVVVLDRLEDGRANWAFAPGGSGRTGGAVAVPVPGMPPAAEPQPADGPGIGLTVRLDSVRVENGVVVYTDLQVGRRVRATGVTLDLSADSLRGPFRLRGDVTVADRPVALDLVTGSVGSGRPLTVEADVLLPDSGDTLSLAGTVSGPWQAPAFEGRLSVAAADLGASLATLRLPPVPAPVVPPGAATLTADLSLSRARATAADLRLGLGEAEVGGRVEAVFGGAEGPALDIVLRTRAVDLDAWTAGAADTASANAGDADGRGASAVALPEPPTGWRGRLDLRADALTWRGEVVRQAVVRGRLAPDGRLHLDAARASLPGAGTVTVAGTLTPTPEGAALSGTVEAEAGNLREVLTWVRLPVEQVPADRLRTFALSARLGGTARTLTISDIDLTLDTTRATGAVVVRPADRLGLGLNLTVDSLNLDAYLPPSDTGPGADAGPTVPAAEASAPEGLSWLAALDANFRVAIGTLTLDALPFTGVRAEGSLVRGALSLSNARIDDVAGAQVTARGGLSGFGDSLRAEGLTLTAETADLSRTARLLRVDLPEPLRGLGAVTQSVTMTGTPAVLDLITATRFQGGGLDTNGRVTGLGAGAPTVDLAVDLRHPDAVRMVRLLVPDYAPRGAPLGALAFSAQARGDAGQVTFDDLDLRLGEMRATGQARLNLDGPRPHLAAGLSTTALQIDAVLPPPREARLGPVPQPWEARLVPAALGGPGAAAALPARPSLPGLRAAAWSTAPLDLSALTTVDADVNLRAAALRYRDQALESADIAARLADGVLQVERLSGRLFDGQVGGALTVVTGAPATYDLRLTVDGFSVARALGLDGPVGAAGTGTLALDMGATGASPAEIVAALSGEGTLDLRELDVRAGQVRGTALAGVLEPVAALTDLTGSLVGDLARAQRLADLEVRFAIDSGVLGFDPLRLTSALYDARFAGAVDLRHWTIDAEGTADLAEGPLREALAAVVTLPDSIPVTVAGDLEAPTVTLRTGRLPAGREAPEDAAARTLREQGARAVEDLAPDAAGRLREVLPGAADALRGVAPTVPEGPGDAGAPPLPAR